MEPYGPPVATIAKPKARFGLPTKPFGPNQPTEFECLVAELGLEEKRWAKSEVLKKWVSKKRHRKYVPEKLLRLWGFSLRFPD